jgi:23S rRNA (uridine2552-2'-O)-methyltransferase
MKACLRCWTRSKKLSSHLWLERQAKDVYVEERERQGYVSRSAFKLVELNAKRRFLKQGAVVLDLGAAPGGWTQVALRLGCKVVSNDLLDHSIPHNDVSLASVKWIKGDFTSSDTQKLISAALGPTGEKTEMWTSVFEEKNTRNKTM